MPFLARPANLVTWAGHPIEFDRFAFAINHEPPARVGIQPVKSSNTNGVNSDAIRYLFISNHMKRIVPLIALAAVIYALLVIFSPKNAQPIDCRMIGNSSGKPSQNCHR